MYLGTMNNYVWPVRLERMERSQVNIFLIEMQSFIPGHKGFNIC